MQALSSNDPSAEALRNALRVKQEDLKRVYSLSIRSVTDVIKAVLYLRSEFKQGKRPCEVLVFDNLTEFQRVSMGDITTSQNEGGAQIRMPKIQDWGVVLMQVQTVVRHMKNLPCHTIFVAHETSRKAGDVEVAGPALSGKIYEELPGYVDCMARYMLMQTETMDPTTQKMQAKETRRLRCHPASGTLS